MQGRGGLLASPPLSLSLNLKYHPGLMVCGVPVGTDAYVAASLGRKVTEVLSNFNIISNELRSAHLQSLHVLAVYSLQHMIEYWAQHAYPSQSAAPLQRFDDGLTDVLAAAHGGRFVVDDSLLDRRLRLPARLRGAGVRRMAQVAPAAFVGTVSLALPQLIDARVGGGTRPGAVPALAARTCLGRGSFDDGNELTRFATLLRSGFRCATELSRAWTALQAERPRNATPPAADLLSQPAAAAGVSAVNRKAVPMLQRALTREREHYAELALDGEILRLPLDDVRRTAWLSCDDFSAALFVAWPAPAMSLRNADWVEAVAMFFGAASPACADYVGHPILVDGERLNKTLDAHGSVLLVHRSLINKDSGRTTWHDSLKFRIKQILDEAQIPHTCEVYGLFAAAMSSAQQQRVASRYHTPAKRRGIVPDFVARDESEADRLMDVKTMALCRSWFSRSLLTQAARGEIVRRRAVRVHNDYVDHAQTIDQQCCQTRRGTVGPVERKLASYGKVQGLIFGPFGEVSAEVRRLVVHAANSVSAHHHQTMGARTAEKAKAAMRLRFRRELALCNMREHARLKLHRLDAYVRGAYSPPSTTASGLASDAARYSARAAAYEASQGFTGFAGWPQPSGRD